MASSALRTTALLVTLNHIFFTLVSSDPLIQEATCPIDGLQFGVCANVLNSLLHGNIISTNLPCCDLFYSLVELQEATCLCKAINANLLGVKLNASVSLSLLFNHYGKDVPSGFQCA